MLTIGLTGGIASGKTTISELFAQLGIPVIDTDLISRRLLEINQPGYQAVVQHFGDDIILENREIDRTRLRRLVFTDSEEKKWLESVLHPAIYQKTRELIDRSKHADYILVVVPLLFEAGFRDLVDRTLVIDCSANIQITRLITRDKINRQLADNMLAQQSSNQARLKQADDVIKNNSNQSLKSKVIELHQKYRELSASSTTGSNGL
jgi:dephospho-CoA kinase